METPDTVYCDLCGERIDARRRCPACTGRSRWRGRVVFVIAGLFWLGALTALAYYKTPYFRPAAVVDGQAIPLSKLEARVEAELARRKAGGRVDGAERRALRSALLDTMIRERILRAASDRAGIDIKDSRITDEIRRYRETHGLSDDQRFGDFVRNRYGSMNRVRDVVAQNLRLAALFEKVRQRAAARGAPAPSVGAWLNDLNRSALVTVKLDRPKVASEGGCCGGSRNSSCASRSGAGCASEPKPADPDLDKRLQAMAVEKAQATFSETSLRARVRDYGCHVQVDVTSRGRRLVSYRYENGRLQNL